jgi:hypothetical protein
METLGDEGSQQVDPVVDGVVVSFGLHIAKWLEFDESVRNINESGRPLRKS